MLRYLTKKKKRERREANHKAVNAIYARAATTFPASYLVCHQDGACLTPNNLLSFTRIGSKFINAHRAADGRFQSLGVDYDFRGDGSLRAINKPPSRVKRLREARQ